MGRRSKSRREETAVPPALTSADTTHPRGRLAAISAGLVLLVVIVFAQVRTHEFLTFDDPIYVTNNEHVKRGLTLDGIAWAIRSFDFNWHPLTWISHMIDVSLFGVNPGAHLLVNVAFHAFNAVFLFLLLTRMTSLLWRSAVVAALFAVHPLHVESVAWLSERKDVLSTAFLLVTMWLYVSFVRSRSRVTYALMLVTFILGLMSKGMLVTLPFVLLLLDWWPLGRLSSLAWTDLWPRVREKIPMFVIVVLASIITFESQRQLASLATTSKLPVLVRVGNALVSYTAYLRRAVWPNDLVIPYQYTTVSALAAAVSAVVLLAITVLVVMNRRARYLATGWFWFVGMIVPVSGLVQIGAYSMADRYTYVPLIGLAIAVVWLVSDLAARHVEVRVAAIALGAFALIGFTAAAYGQTRHWRNSIALFSHTLSVEPLNAFASLNLADALFNSGRAQDSLPYFQRSAQLWPSSAQAHYGLGMALAAAGRNEEAAKSLRRALELDPKNDGALQELGRLELTSGRSAEAAELLARASTSAQTPLSLGTLALARNDLQEALKQFEAAVKADPNSSEAHNNLGATLAKLGRDMEAVKHYEEAIRLSPGHYDGMMNLGALLSRMGRNSEAAENFERAAKVRPNSTEPQVYRALALAIAGNKAGAIEAARRAWAIDPKVANQQFTNATRMPFKETNLEEFVGQLESQQ